MLKRAILSKEYKIYREQTKKEIQERFHVSEFVHMKLNSTSLRRLFKEHDCKSQGYTESHYCCYGPEQSCWEDPCWAGLWGMTEQKVRKHLFDRIRELRPYLQNPERVFRFETDGTVYIYIFLRDTHYKYDLKVWGEREAQIKSHNKAFPEPESCHENVYENETLRLERLWRWAGDKLEEIGEAGLLKGNCNEYYSVVSVEGKKISPVEYDRIDDYSEGFASVEIYDKAKRKSLCGFINRSAELAIPAIYEAVNDFNDGKAKVWTNKGNGGFFIDRNGTPFLVDADGPKYQQLGEFHEGLCKVSTMKLERKRRLENKCKRNVLAYDIYFDYPGGGMSVNDPGMWGFVNEKGDEIISPQYIFAGDFHNGIAVACKGKWEYKENWATNGDDCDEGFWTEEEKWGAIDKYGNEVIPFIFEYIVQHECEDGAEDIFSVCYSDKNATRWGVLDSQGRWLAKSDTMNINPIAKMSKEGLIAFHSSYWPFWAFGDPFMRVGIYDSRSNEILFEPQFIDVGFLEDGGIVVLAEPDDGEGFVTKVIDRNGNERFPAGYSWIDIHNKPYVVSRKRRGNPHEVYGLIDETGKQLLPCVYEIPDWYLENISYEQRRFVFVENARVGLLDFDGNVLIKPRYGSLMDIDKPLISFQSWDAEQVVDGHPLIWGGRCGLVTSDGEEVLPEIFYNIQWCEDGRHIICQRENMVEMYLLTKK